MCDVAYDTPGGDAHVKLSFAILVLKTKPTPLQITLLTGSLEIANGTYAGPCPGTLMDMMVVLVEVVVFLPGLI